MEETGEDEERRKMESNFQTDHIDVDERQEKRRGGKEKSKTGRVWGCSCFAMTPSGPLEGPRCVLGYGDLQITYC